MALDQMQDIVNCVQMSRESTWSTSSSLLLQRQPMTCSQHSMTMVACGSRLILANRSYTRPHKICLLNVSVTQRLQDRRTVSTIVREFQRCEIPPATIDSTPGGERPRLHSLLSDPKVGTEISKTATASRLVKIVFPRT